MKDNHHGVRVKSALHRYLEGRHQEKNRVSQGFLCPLSLVTCPLHVWLCAPKNPVLCFWCPFQISFVAVWGIVPPLCASMHVFLTAYSYIPKNMCSPLLTYLFNECIKEIFSEIFPFHLKMFAREYD